ncbi:MAG TPA: alpha-hydroxy-acid oxidizing enzyme [Oceanospirillaceae bacterium]|nr:alpha-hydroxy-acid oxidizing enzyme [Oceanospirillaceae bacterium]
MTPEQRQLTYPAASDLETKAKTKLPHFAWEYLDSGTGNETLVARNRQAFDAFQFTPRVLAGELAPDLSTDIFGHTYAVPFGIAPVGLSGLMWPQAEHFLAESAARNNLPYCLSMVANETPETVGPKAAGNGWFQLYPPTERHYVDDLLQRAWDSNMRTLVVTLDVPVGSRRERQLRAGLSVPPRKDLKTIYRAAKRPHWSLSTLAYGEPRFKTLEQYFDTSNVASAAQLIGHVINGFHDWELISYIRKQWQGPLVLKGIMHAEDARQAIDAGADAIQVSNHGGRQFDGSPAAIHALPGLVEAINGEAKVFYDSGLRGGLDIMRALALGADFCFLGRPFLQSVAALQEAGPDHLIDILQADLINNMMQIGCNDIKQLHQHLTQV